MASSIGKANLNIMELSRDVTVTVKFRKMREWTMRVKLGSLLLRLAFWILPFETEIEKDD